MLLLAPPGDLAYLRASFAFTAKEAFKGIHY